MPPTHGITVQQKHPKRGTAGVFKAQEECMSSIQINHSLSRKMITIVVHVKNGFLYPKIKSEATYNMYLVNTWHSSVFYQNGIEMVTSTDIWNKTHTMEYD